MARVFFGLLKLYKLYYIQIMKREAKRHPEGYIAALFRWLIPRHEGGVQASLSGHIETPPRLTIVKPFHRHSQQAN